MGGEREGGRGVGGKKSVREGGRGEEGREGGGEGWEEGGEEGGWEGRRNRVRVRGTEVIFSISVPHYSFSLISFLSLLHYPSILPLSFLFFILHVLFHTCTSLPPSPSPFLSLLPPFSLLPLFPLPPLFLPSPSLIPSVPPSLPPSLSPSLPPSLSPSLPLSLSQAVRNSTDLACMAVPPKYREMGSFYKVSHTSTWLLHIYLYTNR